MITQETVKPTRSWDLLATFETSCRTVSLLMPRFDVLAKDARHYDGVIAAMEARGLSVNPALAGGLDGRPAIEARFMKDGKATVDAVVNLARFSLVGGPAYNDTAAAEAMHCAQRS